MARWERIVWLASWVAPLSAGAALLAFGWYVVHDRWPYPSVMLWLIGGLLMTAALTHLTVGVHASRTPRFSMDDRAELKRRMVRGGGHSHWRRLMSQSHATWYKGRSHSGERPRFD